MFERERAISVTREELILSAKPQVLKISRAIHRTLPWHVALEDIIPYGWIGACKAADRFDGRGEFVGYAALRIRGEITDHLRVLDPATRSHRKAIERGSEKPITFVDEGCAVRVDNAFGGLDNALDVAQILAKIPALHASLLRRRFIEDRKAKDIASDLGITGSRVSQIIKTSIERCRACV